MAFDDESKSALLYVAILHSEATMLPHNDLPIHGDGLQDNPPAIHRQVVAAVEDERPVAPGHTAGEEHRRRQLGVCSTQEHHLALEIKGGWDADQPHGCEDVAQVIRCDVEDLTQKDPGDVGGRWWGLPFHRQPRDEVLQLLARALVLRVRLGDRGIMELQLTPQGFPPGSVGLQICTMEDRCPGGADLSYEEFHDRAIGRPTREIFFMKRIGRPTIVILFMMLGTVPWAVLGHWIDTEVHICSPYSSHTLHLSRGQGCRHIF